MKIVDMRNYIALVVNQRGFQTPDWTTVKRWKKIIEDRIHREPDFKFKEGVLQILSLHYDQDFGAEEKVYSVQQIEKLLGLSRDVIIKRAKPYFFKYGRRYVLTKKDFRKVFQGDISG